MSEPRGTPGGSRWPARPRLPGLTTLRTYDSAWLRGDTTAGVTLAAYLVPQVMAYAALAGLGAVAGLWAAVASMAVYALVGSSPRLSVGPESTTALMTAVALSGLAGGSAERYAALAAVLAALVGVVCLVAWAMRLAFFAELLSKPVLVGYMAGVAGLMVVSQLGRLTGLEVPDQESSGAELGWVLGHLGGAHLPTVLLAVAVLGFLGIAGTLRPKAPIPLVGMILAATAVELLHLRARGVAVVGPVPHELPSWGVQGVSPDDLRQLVPAALGIAMVAFTDTVLTARAFAQRGGADHDAGQELLALGAVNLAAAAVHGFPVSSSGSRTAIVRAAGGRSQVHSVVAVVTVVGAVWLGGPVLSRFPDAALGALVVYAATKLVDVRELRRISAFRRTEGMLAVATSVSVLVVGVLPGVLVAVALSVLDLLHRVTRPHDGVLGYVPGVAGMHDLHDYPTASPVPGLIVYRYDAPLFFANAQDFRARATRAIDEAEEPVRWFLLNTEANVAVDITAVDTLESLRQEVVRRGLVFALARVKQELRDDLERVGFLQRVGEEHIFPTLPTAVEAYSAWLSGPGHDEP